MRLLLRLTLIASTLSVACSERVILEAESPDRTRTATLLSRNSDSGVCIEAVVRIVDKAKSAAYESPIGACYDMGSDIPRAYKSLEWRGDTLVVRADEEKENLPDSFDVGPVHVLTERIAEGVTN